MECIILRRAHTFPAGKNQQRFADSWYQRAILDNERNDLSPFFPKEVRGSVDTVPVYCCGSSSRLYQPKYAASVVNFLVGVSNTGFIIQWSKGFTGSTHDSTILSSSKFEEQWLTDVYLADGIFAASKNLLEVAISRN